MSREERIKKELAPQMAIIHDRMVAKLIKYLITGVLDFTLQDYTLAFNTVYRLADDDDYNKYLLNYFKRTLEDYMKSVIKSILEKTTNELVELYISENKKLKILINWMRKVFGYIEGVGLTSRPENSLFTFAHQTFVSEFIPERVRVQIFGAVNELIENDRNELQVDRGLIKQCLYVFEDLDIVNPVIVVEKDYYKWEGDKTLKKYDVWFETFERDSRNYVRTKANTEIVNLSAIEYINSCLRFLDLEIERKTEYIHKNYHERINKINYKYLIEDNMVTLIKMGTGIEFMVSARKDNELKRAFMLAKHHEPSLRMIAAILEPYIKKRGESLHSDVELVKDSRKFVEELIKFKKDIDFLVSDAFNSNILFEDAKNKSFTFFMNKDLYPSKIADYCDYQFRAGLRNKNDTQIEDELNDLINIFKCLNNRLKFQLEYTTKLTDRLLSNATTSIIAEKNFVAKLRAEAGVAFVTKMTTMLQDLENSKVEVEKYKKLSHRGKPFGVDLTVTILGNSSWDIDKTKMEKLQGIPSAIQGCITDFSEFYVRDRSMYKLDFALGLGNLTFQINDSAGFFTTKNIVPTSSIIQYMILTLLEKHEKLTIKQVTQLLGYSSEEIIAYEANHLIFNPAINRTRDRNIGFILTNAPDKKDISPDDEISLNKNFKPVNLKPMTVPMKIKRVAVSNAPNFELINQRIIVDAAIIRIMKGRIGQKTTHQTIIGEIIKQVTMFTPQPPFIKERIESLLEKDFIRRNQNDYNCYDYAA